MNDDKFKPPRLKIQPQSNVKVPVRPEEKEALLLGAALWDVEKIHILAGALSPADFRSHRNSVIYKALLEMRERGLPHDLPTLRDQLDDSGKLEEAGGVDYILFLCEFSLNEKIRMDAEDTDKILGYLKWRAMHG